MRVPCGHPLSLLLACTLMVVGCRSDPTQECSSRRVWQDSTGEHDERARIQVQWARIQGTYDSLASTTEGLRVVERAAGSLEHNEARYSDSIVAVDGAGRSVDGCVDWRASWVAGAFDRQALATVLLRRSMIDTSFGAVEFRLDTTRQPMELEVEASPSVPTTEEGLRTVTFQIDSTGMRLVEP